MLLSEWDTNILLIHILQVPKSKAYETTEVSIDIDCRHIDAAYVYQNEEDVGAAMRVKMVDGTVKREDFFYTSKVCRSVGSAVGIAPSLKESMWNLAPNQLWLD